MPNMRIVYDNAIDRASGLVASTTAATFSAANLKLEKKSKIWRSTARSATLTVDFPAAELVKCVVLPWTNFSATATMRVRGYTLPADANPAFDTTPLLCAKYVPQGPWGWEAIPVGANAFAYGGGAYASLWFTGGSVRKLVIDIADNGNVRSYVEAARLVAGDYWSPSRNANWGASLQWADLTKHERSDAGEMLSQRGTRHRKMTLPLQQMPAADRNRLLQLARANGMVRPMLVSLYPEDADAQLEQDHMIWCKPAQAATMSVPQYALYNTQLDLEEL